MKNIKQQAKQNIPPPSPEFIRQLNSMGYVITNGHVLIKIPQERNHEVKK